MHGNHENRFERDKIFRLWNARAFNIYWVVFIYVAQLTLSVMSLLSDFYTAIIFQSQVFGEVYSSSRKDVSQKVGSAPLVAWVLTSITQRIGPLRTANITPHKLRVVFPKTWVQLQKG